MQVELPDKVCEVEAMLAKRGENGDGSKLIDRTLHSVRYSLKPSAT
jgi:hypothetical protein